MSKLWKFVNSLSILLRCVAFLANEGYIRNIFVELALDQGNPFASFVKDLVLKTNCQIICKFLFTFRVILVLGLLALDL